MPLEIPKGDWTFKNIAVCKNFGEHVREQLPWYDLATGAAAHYARHYIERNSIVYDLGCSTGNFGNAIRSTIIERSANLIAIDESEQMIDVYEGPGRFVCTDLEHFDPEPFSVAVLFLTLMFLKREARKGLVNRLVRMCSSGGAIIIFDKIESDGGYIGQATSRLTLAGKLSTNTSPNDILAKEMSLSGIQRPLSKNEIIGKQVFQFGEFSGFVYEGLCANP